MGRHCSLVLLGALATVGCASAFEGIREPESGPRAGDIERSCDADCDVPGATHCVFGGFAAQADGHFPHLLEHPREIRFRWAVAVGDDCAHNERGSRVWPAELLDTCIDSEDPEARDALELEVGPSLELGTIEIAAVRTFVDSRLNVTVSGAGAYLSSETLQLSETTSLACADLPETVDGRFDSTQNTLVVPTDGATLPPGSENVAVGEGPRPRVEAGGGWLHIVAVEQ